MSSNKILELEEKCWNIPDDIDQQISSKCSDGLYLVCKVCEEWDFERRSFACVDSCGKFWYGRFTEHLKTKRHENNCLTKAYFDEVNQKRVEDGKAPRKRLKQTVLPFATDDPSPKEIRNRILGGVAPNLATGGLMHSSGLSTHHDCGSSAVALEFEDKNNEIMNRFFENHNNKESEENAQPVLICEGILAKKDLSDKKVQAGIKYWLKYGVFKKYESNYDIKLVKNSDMYSLFDVNCGGEDSTVRYVSLADLILYTNGIILIKCYFRLSQFKENAVL